MKPIALIGVVIVVVLGVFYFTKPSDDNCRNAAMKIVSGDISKVPGYSDPNVSNMVDGTAQPDKVLITDRVLWKDISYVYPASVKKIGRGYLGSFHSSGKSSQ